MTGAPEPSPDDNATAPVPHHRANLDSRANLVGSPTSTTSVAAAIADAWLVSQGRAVFVKEMVEFALEHPDLPVCLAVSIDERNQPRQPVVASDR